MEGASLLLLSSGLFLGWTLGANDAANVFGAAVGTRMIRFATAALVCSAFVILGAVVSGAGVTDTLGRLGAVDRQAGAFTCALAAGFTVYYMTKWGLPVSTTQAIVGAIVGWNLFSDSPTDASTFATIVSTWVLCPVLAGLVAVPLFVASRRFLDWANLHLLRVDALTRFALLFAGAFGAYSLGANNIANVMGVFVESTPFEALSLQGGFTLTSAQQLFLLGGVAIAAGVLTYSKRVMFTVGSGIAPMSPLAAWVVVIAHSIVLFAFASEGLERLLAAHGLPTIPLVPVSSSQAVVGAIVGLGMMRGGRDIDWRLVRNVGIGWITTPLVAALACFIALFFVQNVFDQPVYREKRFALSLEVLDRIGEHTVATKELAQLASHEFTGAPAFLGGAYRAPPVRRVEIPKPDGGTRPLGVAALEDKIVQKAVVDVILTPIHEVEFLGFSYGFRPGQGAHDALDALAFGIERRKVSWIVDADLRAYFDTIPRDWLITFLEHRIGDRRVIRLIRKWLNAGVMEGGSWMDAGMGTPQGNIVSPLLSERSDNTGYGNPTREG